MLNCTVRVKARLTAWWYNVMIDFSVIMYNLWVI